MQASLRQLIRDRAQNRCEYCRVSQAVLRTSLQVEHIIARQHLGGNAEDNLALACDRCNSHKGPNLSGIDPENGTIVRLYDPRSDEWHEHFALADNAIVGLTPIGRTTVQLLQFNSETRMRLREVLIAEGKW